MFASKDLFFTNSSGYKISRSVRLRSSATAYFNRTFGTPTSNIKWTLSSWVKRGSIGSSVTSAFIGSSLGGASTYFMFSFNGDAFDILQVTSGSIVARLTTSSVYRDPSSWYHVVMVWDSGNATSSSRLLLYVNGVQLTAFSTATYPSLNLACSFNASGTNVIGYRNYASDSYFDGYMTEANFIDGQALTPSSFGETDTLTGVWKPKKYAGTYGNNGYYLNFSDNSSNTATTIGKDYSGNGNNWTPNNISVTAGVTYDSMLDVPTLYADGGNGRGNYAVMNPVSAVNGFTRLSTYADGNLNVSSSGVADRYGMATILPSSGKWYVETVVTSLSSGVVGIGTGNASFGVYNQYFSNSGAIYKNSSSSTTGATFTTGDVIGTAFDVDAGSVYFYKNNTLQATLTGCTDTSAFQVYTSNTTTLGINFGQRPFSYTPPTGFVALNTQNLPAPTISNGAQYMAASTYTGTGATQSIVNSGNNAAGISFQPDFVWIKDRSAARSHRLFDAVRGATKALFSDATDAETTLATDLTAFNSNGFTLGAGAGSNSNTETFVGWQWKASGSTVSNTSGTITSTVSAGATQGFSVVTYTGNGSAGATCGHGLGVSPSMIIWKNRNDVDVWIVYHKALTTSEYMVLNTTAAKATYSGLFTGITSTVIPLNNASAGINASAKNYVAYCFSEVAGYSKFGSYTGNGSTDGPFVFCGFRPRFLMIKRTDSTGNWDIFDTSRNPYNATGLVLYPNISSAEQSFNPFGDILSNGFKVRNGAATDFNASGGTYIFMAIAENPFKLSLAR